MEMGFTTAPYVVGQVARESQSRSENKKPLNVSMYWFYIHTGLEHHHTLPNKL